MLCLGFVIPHQPPLFHEPAKGPLYHPTPGQTLEADLSMIAFDNVQMQATPRAQGLHPSHQRPSIAAVRPNLGQLAIPAHAPLQERFGSVPILFVGRTDLHPQEQAQNIHQDVPFAAGDFLAGIVAAHASLIADLDRLAVQHRRRRAGLATSGHADTPAQDVMEAVPQPALNPWAVNPIDRAPGAKFVGQQTPGTARALQVADPVNDAPAIRRRSARVGRTGEKRA